MKLENFIHTLRSKALKLAGILTLAAILAPVSAHAGSWVYGTYSSTQGARAYQLWVPTGYVKGTAIPMVVALHGCGQTASQWAELTRINTLADSQKFMVLYPKQTLAVNPSGCWNWFLSTNQARGYGEPAIVKGMVDLIKSRYTVNSRKVYVFGLSAGAAMTSTMLACYSDVFAAGGIGAGFMYKAATNALEAGTLSNGSHYSPTQRGYDAWTCSGKPKPRKTGVIVFQGSSDPLVTPINASQLVTQFAKTNDYSDDGYSNSTVKNVATSTSTGSAGGRTYTYRNYYYGGKNLINYYTINGMGHTWSGGNQLYSPGFSTAGPNATSIMWNFFKQHSL